MSLSISLKKNFLCFTSSNIKLILNLSIFVSICQRVFMYNHISVFKLVTYFQGRFNRAVDYRKRGANFSRNFQIFPSIYVSICQLTLISVTVFLLSNLLSSNVLQNCRLQQRAQLFTPAANLIKEFSNKDFKETRLFCHGGDSLYGRVAPLILRVQLE